MPISLKIVKFLCAGISALTSLIGSGFIFCVRRPKLISCAESLAGGALLGAAFSHLFQDSANEIFLYGTMKYPLAGALAISTFVILTTIELFSYNESETNKKSSNIPSKRSSSYNKKANHNSFVIKRGSLMKIGDKKHPIIHDSQVQDICDQHDQNNQEFEENNIRTHLINDTDLKSGSNSLPQIQEKEFLSEKSENSFFGSEFHLFSIPVTTLYLVMLIRSFIEGLALGIVTNYRGVIALICAIGGYKPLESFALGLILSKDKPVKWLYWIMIIVSAIMAPIGTIAAIYISEIENHLILGIISSISVGTFAFMGCDEWSKMFEKKDIWDKKDKARHLGLFLLGVGWMLLIAIINR